MTGPRLEFRPPRLASGLVRRLTRPAHADLVLADLADDYREHRMRRGPVAAHLRYWRLALASIASRWSSDSVVTGSGHSIGVDTVLADARQAIRSLRSRPAFSAVTILTLALGVGANTAIYSVMNGVLVRPLPYDDPAAVVNVWQVFRAWQRSEVEAFRIQAERFPASWPVYREWRARSRTLSDLSAYATGARVVERGGSADWVSTIDATASLVNVLGVAPAAGRWYRDDDEQMAVVSHGFALRWFGDRDSAIGAPLRLSSTPYTIIGVMPPGFYFPDLDYEIWTPLHADRRNERWTSQSMSVVARLAADVSIEDAGAEMSEVADAIMLDYPEAIDAGARVVSRVEEVAGATRSTLLLLMAAVGLVLLVATANVAGLLLVRASARQQEFMVRAALGAGGRRLFAQMMTEGVVLALAGGGVGLAVLAGTFGWVRGLLPPATPRLAEVVFDWRVCAFALSVSLAAAVLFGATSAVHAVRQSRRLTLRHDGTRASARQFGRSALVIAEVAVSVVLLAGAALLVQSYLRLSAMDPGFRQAGLLTATVTAPVATWQEPNRLRGFFDETMAGVSALPGVSEAGAVSTLPFSGGSSSSSFGLVEAPTVESETGWSLEQRATPGYFDAMGIRLLRGRLFGPEDGPDAPRAVVINERLAQVYFADRDPIGQRIWDDGEPGIIVGVVSQVRHRRLDEEIERKRYSAFAQDPSMQMTVVVHTTGDPTALASMLRAAVVEVEPLSTVTNVATMERRVADAMALPRFRTTMIGLLAVVAIVLAAGGLYGVLALSVAGRTREIGIRMSLGARRIDVTRQVVGSGLRLILPGIVLGTIAAVAASRLLESYLFQTPLENPLTFGLVAACVTLLAVTATLIPARRASRVDPLQALRAE